MYTARFWHLPCDTALGLITSRRLYQGPLGSIQNMIDNMTPLLWLAAAFRL